MQTHIHSLDRCAHDVHGEEVLWQCGMLPMFTNVATARASDGQVDDGDVVSIEADGTGWAIVLRSREGGRLTLAHRRNATEATFLRDSIAGFLRSWFHDHTIAPTLDDVAAPAMSARAQAFCVCGHRRIHHYDGGRCAENRTALVACPCLGFTPQRRDSTASAWPGGECQHLSATGVDQNEGPDKVWACDGCGWRHYVRTDDAGITRMTPAPIR